MKVVRLMYRWLVESHRARRTLLKFGVVSLGVFVVGFVLLDRFVSPLPISLLHRPSATFLYARDGQLLHASTSSDHFWRRPVPLDQISQKLIASVLATEDKYFYYHPGVNPVSLVAAAVTNVRAGRVVRGGSTITMQIARMIEPKERTIGNKVFEIFRALQLELRYSKSELLEIYFNLVPYGGNIEGVGAASLLYFNKPPRDLTWSEAALLTALPGSPERFRPDKAPAAGRARANIILQRLTGAGVLSIAEHTAAQREQIPEQRTELPFHAPHLATNLRAHYPDSSLFTATLDYELQLQTERLAAGYAEQYALKGIHNLAIVVIDNDRSEIIARVGSPDFFDTRHSGQVDAAMAPRSPGSALKPFVYGLACERGLLSPETKIADVPVNYRGYRPVNYDEQYRGVVSVREALEHSLNVPAVETASDIGLKQVHGMLVAGGLTSLSRPHYEYGLPLVLGGCEVRLDELTNLYAALARGGEFVPARVLKSNESVSGVSLLSPEVCYLLSDILVDVRRPELPNSWQATAGGFPIAWKTGTSYGRRDAWAIGYTPSYTVGVWAGNCSGEGSVDLVGATIAAPVMFRVFEVTSRGEKPTWFERPDRVKERPVCSVSGRPMGRFCGESQAELFVPGQSPVATCTVHRPIFVDAASGLRLTAQCTNDREYERVVVERWPPRLATWLVAHGLQAPLPPFDSSCSQTTARSITPGIISPEEGTTYELIAELPVEYQKIRLQATLASGGGRLHWFVNGTHLASAGSGETVFYTPEKGRHTLLCVDDAGASATASIVIQ